MENTTSNIFSAKQKDKGLFPFIFEYWILLVDASYLTQVGFKYSKLIIETREQDVKYVQS